MGEYICEEHNKGVAELESIQKIKMQKKEVMADPEDLEIIGKLSQQKTQRNDPFMHFEGDTDVEEMYKESEDS